MKTKKDIPVDAGFFNTGAAAGFTAGAFGTGTCVASSMYNLPIFIEANEVGESIEFIYKESSAVAYTTFPPQYPPDRVFKVVFSCKDGKWHKSERIYGEVIPASEETYEFEYFKGTYL
jgi:hypothetical protein